MRKKIKILKEYFRVNKKVFLFFEILLLIGIISGSIFSLTLSETDSNLVSEYLNNLVTSISNNSYKNILSTTILSNSFIVIVIFLLGFNIIGILFNLLILFYKSFTIGFCLSSFIINFKTKGILYSFLYVFPHQAFFMVLLTVLISYSINISLGLLKLLLKRDDSKVNTLKYFKLFILTFILTLLISFYEAIIVPRLLFEVCK